MSEYILNPNLYNENVEKEAIRVGFGRGLKKAGELNENVVALCADLTGSTKVDLFSKAFPERFVQVGIAEQNLVAVASGLAMVGKIPFASSYAAFNPGRNWEQIKTTAALNEQPVKVVGGHAGIGVGPDGATHQMLEDIAIMRVLPNMVVVVPGDSLEAEKATMAIAENDKPCYLRLARVDTPIISTSETPFEIGKAYIVREGEDISLFGTGVMTYQLMDAARILSERGISAEVVHVPTIKPLDSETILFSARKTGRVVTAEEAQIAGGFGSAVAELLSEKMPTPLMRIGMNDIFGESGEPDQLFDHFGLTGPKMADKIEDYLKSTPQYHRDY